jgi:hypothetical protein
MRWNAGCGESSRQAASRVGNVETKRILTSLVCKRTTVPPEIALRGGLVEGLRLGGFGGVGGAPQVGPLVGFPAPQTAVLGKIEDSGAW